MEGSIQKRGRVGEMELWRFFFSVIIVFHHSRNLVGNEDALFFNGAYAVEFFFILSGYLLMQSVARMGESTRGIGLETVQFIKKKYLSLCPDLFIAWIIGFIATVVITRCDAIDLFTGGFWEMTLLHMGGLYIERINSAVWYLSSMLLGMIVLYPLLRKYKQTAQKLIVPLISVLLLGWFFQETGSLRVPFDWDGLTFKANLRAIADLGLGVICYQTTQWFAALRLNKGAKLLVTLAKYFCYAVLTHYMLTVDEITAAQDFFLLFFWMIAIGLTFSRQSIANGIFDHKFVFFLGKFSLPLYLSHYYWSNLLGDLLPKGMGDAYKVAIFWAVSLATAAVVMALSALWKRHRDAIFRLPQKLFLK